ncbi:hypothetical protein EBU99_02350 [bacterium]|nr:hypothetical protein [bacterium]
MKFNQTTRRVAALITTTLILAAVVWGVFLRSRGLELKENRSSTAATQTSEKNPLEEKALLVHAHSTHELRTYAVVQDLSVELLPSAGRPTVSEIHLRAQLDEQVLSVKETEVLYRYKFHDVTFQSTDARGNPALSSNDATAIAQSLSAQSVLLRTDRVHRVVRLSAPRGMTLETLNLYRSVLLSRFVYLPPEKQLSEWASEELDSTGVFTLNNKLIALNNGVANIEKEPRTVRINPADLRERNAEQVVAVLPGSLTRMSFDVAAGLVVKSEQRWTLRLQAAGIQATNNLRTQIEFVGKRSAQASDSDVQINDAGDPAATAYMSDFELEANHGSSLRRKVAAQKLAGETWDSLRARLNATDFHRDGAARFQFLEQLSALMILQPESATVVAEEIARLNKNDPDYSSKLALLAGAFSNQDSPESEAAMVELARRMKDDPQALMQLIPAMAAHHNPSERSRDQLVELYENGTTPDVKATATLALGTFASRALRARPELAREVVARIKTDFDATQSVERKVTLSGALGNSGAQEALPSVKEVMGKTTAPALQKSAIYDLRFVNDPAVDVYLQKIALDSSIEPELVIQSLRVMRMRAPLRASLDAALTLSRSSSERATVRSEALYTIAQHAPLAAEEVRSALVQTAREGNSQLAQQAQQLLAKLPKAKE